MKQIKIFILFVTLAVIGTDAFGQKNARPNILWLVSEDNSPYLGCYGDPVAQTPNLDKLGNEGVIFDMAFANAPVCAPSRSTLITGMFASSLGTENMRSYYPIPKYIKFFPQYLREVGYYCTNNAKEDYNMPKPKGVWDESSNRAHYKNRKPGQPFFAVFNYGVSHESSLHRETKIKTDLAMVRLNPHYPDILEVRQDYAKYYDRIHDMDAQIGAAIAELKAAGEYENTIIFYYSDHGGVLPWSKRFISDAGTKVPLIVHVPEKFRKLSPFTSGTRTNRIVNFVDFGPTLLSLASIKPAENMQGIPFMGKYEANPREVSIAYRGRADERIDLSRGIRTQKYHYTINYMPWKIYGQYLEFLWKAPSLQAWEAYYRAGKCTPLQSRFFNPKDVEELYDVENDPYETINLAKDPAYKDILSQLRQKHFNFIAETMDVGFIPEGEIVEMTQTSNVYDKVREDGFPLDEIQKMAFAAVEGKDMELLRAGVTHDNASVRYWAAQGLAHIKLFKEEDLKRLLQLTDDPSGSVRLSAAEGLYLYGKTKEALRVLAKDLRSNNIKVALQAANLLDLMGADARPISTEAVMGHNDYKYLVRSLQRWMDEN